MTQLLPGFESEMRSRAQSQFYTPSWLSARMVHWAWAGGAFGSVLEPAAGQGALLVPLADLPIPTLNVEAWDIDDRNVAVLRRLATGPWLAPPMACVQAVRVVHGDFLACEVTGSWALGLMNPPYEQNQDVAFIERALEHCDRVVGVFQSRIVHSAGRAQCWRWTDIARMAILIERPNFGLGDGGKTDFVVLELTRRYRPRKQGEATPAAVEWWSR